MSKRQIVLALFALSAFLVGVYGYYHNVFGAGIKVSELPLASWTTSTYNGFALDATGISWINKSGYTLLGVRNSRDTDNIAPTGNNIIIAYGADSVGTTQDPLLIIEHYPSIIHPRISPSAGINAGSLGGSIFW